MRQHFLFAGPAAAVKAPHREGHLRRLAPRPEAEQQPGADGPVHPERHPAAAAAQPLRAAPEALAPAEKQRDPPRTSGPPAPRSASRPSRASPAQDLGLAGRAGLARGGRRDPRRWPEHRAARGATPPRHQVAADPGGAGRGAARPSRDPLPDRVVAGPTAPRAARIPEVLDQRAVGRAPVAHVQPARREHRPPWLVRRAVAGGDRGAAEAVKGPGRRGRPVAVVEPPGPGPLGQGREQRAIAGGEAFPRGLPGGRSRIGGAPPTRC
jgi:hypothetical protein